MAEYVVRDSSLIDTLEEAWAYYRARFVGERVVSCGGVPVTLRFNAEETHLFSESIREGASPAPGSLVHRPGGGGEVREFSKGRARLLDDIVPTICAPTLRVEAKTGKMLIGNLRPTPARQRLAVVVARSGEVYFVRTAYLIGEDEYRRHQRQGRRTRWPPDEK